MVDFELDDVVFADVDLNVISVDLDDDVVVVDVDLAIKLSSLFWAFLAFISFLRQITLQGKYCNYR